MRRSEKEVFGAPLEVLHKKRGSTPCSTFFLEPELLELDAFGCEIFGVGGVEQFFVEWSAPKHPLTLHLQHISVDTFVPAF